MIKQLPKTLTKEGHHLTLIERKGHVCIYRSHLPFGEESADSFEVIIPHIYKRNFNGPCPPYEGYPGTNEWGRKGWTETSLSKAKLKMEQLLK